MTSFAGLTLDRPRIMGVINVTPDSFSDGGLRFDHARAIDHGLRLRSEGADILDIGGESTRPGAVAIDPDEELRRVLPVVRGLARGGSLISIDTRHAAVMRAAIGEGAAIVNDVSALRDDPDSIATVAASRAPVILMHRRGMAVGTFHGPAYGDVVEDVRTFLLERAAACLAAGIERSAIALDPGIGFGKNVNENLQLILGVPRLADTGFPVLIGASRKSFLGLLTAVEDPADRLGGSLAVAVEAVRRGAAILRVHDVAATRQALIVAQAFNTIEQGGSAFPPPETAVVSAS